MLAWRTRFPRRLGEGQVSRCSSTHRQAHTITGGIWLIGLGVMFATGYWWPGILILAGITAIVEGWALGQGWYGLQGASG